MKKIKITELCKILETIPNDDSLSIKQIQINDFEAYYNNLTTKQLLEFDVRILEEISNSIIGLINEQVLSQTIQGDFINTKSDIFLDNFI